MESKRGRKALQDMGESPWRAPNKDALIGSGHIRHNRALAVETIDLDVQLDPGVPFSMSEAVLPVI